MKKLIATLSIFSALGFAVALANTGTSDTNTMHESPGISGDTTTHSTTGDMPGTSSDTTSDTTTSMPSDSTTTKSTTETTTSKRTSQNDHWATAKTCTDTNGVVHYRGKSGFKACVQEMRKSERDQMGGTLPNDTLPDGSTPSVNQGVSSDSNRDATSSGSVPSESSTQ